MSMYQVICISPDGEQERPKLYNKRRDWVSDCQQLDPGTYVEARNLNTGVVTEHLVMPGGYID